MDTLTHEPASPGEGGWHLAPADHALVAAKSRVNRLRFAVMLLFFRDRGRFPRGADILDPEAMARLASALNVPLPPEPVAFDVGDRTLERQRSEIRALFDFREATVADAAALGTWLCDHAVAQSRDHDRLAAELEAHCRTLRIEPPAPDRVERIVRGAVRAYEYRFTTGIYGRLATEVTMTPFGSTAQMPDPQALEARPAVERIAAFAAAARPEHLAPDIRQLFKRNILDSLGCAIAALPGQPFQALREQFEEYRAPGRCTLIGGGKTSPDQAALFNSALVRYVDLLDSYMSPGGLCHPSDNFGTVLAAAEHVGASGEDFMLALAVAYEIQCRFTAVVPVMAKGFNHAIQLAISASRERRETLRALRRPNRQRDRDRDGRQRLARLRACRTGVAVEGLLARDDGDARRLRRLAGQARLHGSKRPVRRPERAGTHVRPDDSGGLG